MVTSHVQACPLPTCSQLPTLAGSREHGDLLSLLEDCKREDRMLGEESARLSRARHDAELELQASTDTIRSLDAEVHDIRCVPATLAGATRFYAHQYMNARHDHRAQAEDCSLGWQWEAVGVCAEGRGE